MNVISVGEVLWDLVGHDEHLGGAPFNFAAHLARLGHTVTFISALGQDERGDRILNRMQQMGLSTRYVRSVQEYATGVVTVSLDSAGLPDYVIHRPAAYDFPQLGDDEIAELFSTPVDWIYFGTLLQMSPAAKAVTMRLLHAGRESRRFYDINLRKGSWQPSLVLELMELATMVKLNVDEAREVSRMLGGSSGSLEKFCRTYAARFHWQGICVTNGAQGCALLWEDEFVEAEGYAVRAKDTVGSGDAFAAALLHGLACGWPLMRAADFANRVGAIVASREGAIPGWTIAEVEGLSHNSNSRSHPESQNRETA